MVRIAAAARHVAPVSRRRVPDVRARQRTPIPRAAQVCLRHVERRIREQPLGVRGANGQLGRSHHLRPGVGERHYARRRVDRGRRDQLRVAVRYDLIGQRRVGVLPIRKGGPQRNRRIGPAVIHRQIGQT